MAIIGGRPQVLMDLRANILARKARYNDGSDPRLLRILDEWINHFEYGVQRIIREGCDILVTVIGEAYQEISDYKDKRATRRAAKGKAPKERRGRHRHPKQLDTPTPSLPHRNSQAEPIDSRNNTPDIASTPPTPTAAEENRTEEMAWNWLDDRMQDLSAEEQDEVMNNVHPAFSELHLSAVPSSLHPRQHGARSRVSRGSVVIEETASNGQGAQNDNEDEGSWVSVSVMTANPDSNEDDATTPKASNFQRDNVHPISRFLRLSDTEDEDEDEDGAYVPARANWNNIGREEPSTFRPPGVTPPASSFYSDHPGFPTNHKVTVVNKRPVERKEQESEYDGPSLRSYSPASWLSM